MVDRSVRPLSKRRREALEGYLFILPWFFGFLVFTAGPMLASLGLSFTKWNLLQPPSWNGIANYVHMVSDPLFWHSLGVTVRYTLISVPARLVLALAVAMLLTHRLPGMNAFRTIYFLPAIIGGIPVALLWSWVFNPDFGILNYLLSLIGIQGPQWLSNTDTALWAVIIMSLWDFGVPMLIFIAGLQNIPPHLYESAELDGANWLGRLFYITLPMLSPTVLFLLISQVISSFQVFDIVYGLQPGNLGAPSQSTLVYLLYFYQTGFRFYEMGYASALIWVLLVLILLLTAALFRSSDLWVFYESEVKR
ncbi:MAG: carbohydrate ABC transporter permease [Roseiflexaceae bacterium]